MKTNTKNTETDFEDETEEESEEDSDEDEGGPSTTDCTPRTKAADEEWSRFINDVSDTGSGSDTETDSDSESTVDFDEATHQHKVESQRNPRVKQRIAADVSTRSETDDSGNEAADVSKRSDSDQTRNGSTRSEDHTDTEEGYTPPTTQPVSSDAKRFTAQTHNPRQIGCKKPNAMVNGSPTEETEARQTGINTIMSLLASLSDGDEDDEDEEEEMSSGDDEQTTPKSRTTNKKTQDQPQRSKPVISKVQKTPTDRLNDAKEQYAQKVPLPSQYLLYLFIFLMRYSLSFRKSSSHESV